MKILIILLFMLSVNAAHANDIILFMTKPSNVTIDDAIGSVKTAAIKRNWTVHEVDNNKLRTELEHRGYKGLLEFSFTEDHIYYSDLTTYYNRSKSVWELSPTPDRWIQNLRDDTISHFVLVRRDTPVKESFSHDDIEKKLESLKVLYNKNLITETQYQLKLEEIMSRY